MTGEVRGVNRDGRKEERPYFITYYRTRMWDACHSRKIGLLQRLSSSKTKEENRYECENITRGTREGGEKNRRGEQEQMEELM